MSHGEDSFGAKIAADGRQMARTLHTRIMVEPWFQGCAVLLIAFTFWGEAADECEQ